MDVFGKKPTSEVGKYFCNNCWWWRPLWNYCADVAPDIISEDLHRGGQYNDGVGLDATGSRRLAKRLEKLRAEGHTREFARAYAERLAAIPDEPCDLCDGTGKRLDFPADRTCNKCEGAGKVRPFETWYPFSEENVHEFVAFLKDCGGFEIH